MIRVVVHHFALPRYRLPVFRMLAQTEGIDLKVVFAEAPGLDNVAAAGFVAEPGRTRRLRTRRAFLAWDSTQLRFARRRNADILVLTWNTRYLSLFPALLRAKRQGVRTILWGHGYSRREARWRLRVRRFMARFADAVIFYNHRDARSYVAATGRSDSTFVALNSLDQGPIQQAREEWTADPDSLAAFRRENGLEGRPMILFVSRFLPANRLDLLIEATNGVRERHPDVVVAIIGDRTDQQPDLHGLVTLHGLESHVRFLGPRYDEQDLAAWFLAADVFCYPSNIGLSILHAFGYGLPVVTGDRADKANPEWEALRPGVNGLVYRDGDVDALADVLNEILEDPEMRRRLGEGARRTALEEYSLDLMVDGLREAIDYCARL